MEVLFEVDFLTRIHALTKQHVKLMYHKQNHVVFRDGELVGGAREFIDLAISDYDIPDAEAANTIVYNRFVRESSARMLKERGRPIVYIEFADAASRPSDAVKLGVIQIEL
jgi:hypothetical protein